MSRFKPLGENTTLLMSYVIICAVFLDYDCDAYQEQKKLNFFGCMILVQMFSKKV